MTPGLRAATYQTLVGLLLVTGARVGELTASSRDVGLEDGVAVITDSSLTRSLIFPCTRAP